jgi:hypothetical protein
MLISKESAFSTIQSIRLNNYLYPYFEKNKTKKERGNESLFLLNPLVYRKKG